MGLDSDARRRGLIEYLSLNGYATMRQLAGEFDVSINTIQRDITYLARYYPLETAYGRYGGGVYFEQNWQPYRIYMTPLQERALQHAISSAAAEDVVPLQEILQTFARKSRLTAAGTFPPKRATLESTP